MTVSIEGTYKPIEVDLWGEVYTTIDLPRSKALEADKLNAQIQDLADEDGDKGIELVASLMDLRLAAKDGQAVPSELLNEKWLADELTLRQLQTFLVNLADEEGGENRPT